VDVNAMVLVDDDDDGDGRTDLLFAAQQVGSGDFIVGVRRQQADGRYAAAARLHTLAPISYCVIRSIGAADLDGDGRPDIFVTGDCAPLKPLTVLRQQADGSFVTETPAAAKSFSPARAGFACCAATPPAPGAQPWPWYPARTLSARGSWPTSMATDNSIWSGCVWPQTTRTSSWPGRCARASASACRAAAC